MVSLKSFKPINEAERDETLQPTSVAARSTQNINSNGQLGTFNFTSTDQQGQRRATSMISGHQQQHVDYQHEADNNSSQFEPNRPASTSIGTVPPTLAAMSAESNMKGMMNETIHKRNIVKVVLPPVVSSAAAAEAASTTKITTTSLPTKQPLSQQAHHQHNHNRQQDFERREQAISPAASSSGSSISIVVVQHENSTSSQLAQSTTAPATSEDDYTTQDELSSGHSLDEQMQTDTVGPTVIGLPVAELSGGPFLSVVTKRNVPNNNNNELRLYPRGGPSTIRSSKASASNSGGPPMNGDSRLSVADGGHFEIVWSNLSCRIEPKWYKKINILDRVFSHFMPDQTIDNHSSATSTASSSAGMNDNQHQMHTSHANADGSIHNSSSSSCCPKNKSPQDPIEIFTNLNGTIKSGQMTAVLGPSGAGKTTLLNCLTGKLRKGISGHINLIGANGKHLKMCTIPQKDHLLELLTVEENLWFASKIKNPEFGFDHVKNIERVIDLLGLKRCRSAKIKKISGGQYKRVSIAQELLSNPDILVLDEPTSGLDSLTCYKTISMLRDLVELSASNEFMKPMAIIVTIHQPQPKVFNLFHHVYILANGGRVIYEGAPELSLETITGVTGLQPLDGSKSAACMTTGIVDPASFLIEIASEEYGSEPIKTLNDHQRRVFYETTMANGHQAGSHQNLARNNNKNGHMQQNLSREGQFHHYMAKDNHGFSPDFDNSTTRKSSSRELSAVFVPNNQMYNKNTKEQSSENSNNNNNNDDDDDDDDERHEEGVISDSSDRQPKGPKGCKQKKKSSYSLKSGMSTSSSTNSSGGDASHRSGSAVGGMGKRTPSDNSLYMSEQLLYTREANHKGRFWSHTATLTHRTLLTIRRDPLLMTSRVLFHLMIPILMGHVYGKATGAANACPHYEPEIDITQIPSLVEGKRIEYMLEELHMSIENVSMFFIIMYAFAAAVLALNALSFPLNMQVLLKETRNGWYSMSSYVLAKTLADLPLELTMPCLTMALVYPLTGQPSSYLQWRMLTICLIMTLCSLIAQTQALILGALVMNSVQTAVFISQASQLPWVILAGFTIRIKRLSEPLKLISLTSFYRLGCEAITLTRYGFGICPCNPQEITGEPVRLVGIPDQLRTIAQYWIDSMDASKANNDTTSGETTTIGDQLTDLETTTQMVPTTTASSIANAIVANLSSTSISQTKTDIFQHLANQLSYANSYGVNITSCDDVAPDRIRAINLSDNWLVARIWHLIIMLLIMKILLYYAVKFSIGIRL